jgi:hypothetical protein
MTPSSVTCAVAEQSLGALVLGALDPREREQVEEHVRSCSSCSSTLTELAPLPGLLHRVDLTADDLAPPPLAVLARAPEHARALGPPAAVVRRRRWLPVAAAVAAAVAAITVGLGVHARLSPGPVGTVIASGASTSTRVAATVTMTPTPGGTRLALALSGVAPGQHCELVAVSRSGSREVASSWVATYDGAAQVTGSTWLTLADIERLEITTADGATLLRVDVPA